MIIVGVIKLTAVAKLLELGIHGNRVSNNRSILSSASKNVPASLAQGKGLSNHIYKVYIKQAGLEFQHTQGLFKTPIISTYAKITYISCC